MIDLNHPDGDPGRFNRPGTFPLRCQDSEQFADSLKELTEEASVIKFRRLRAPGLCQVQAGRVRFGIPGISRQALTGLDLRGLFYLNRRSLFQAQRRLWKRLEGGNRAAGFRRPKTAGDDRVDGWNIR